MRRLQHATHGCYLVPNQVEKLTSQSQFSQTACIPHINTGRLGAEMHSHHLKLRWFWWWSWWGLFHTSEHRVFFRLYGLGVYYPAHKSLSLKHGKEANCQLLCPHYPCPPAQTGALGHCPRNHSAPVAHKESQTNGRPEEEKQGGQSSFTRLYFFP